MRTVIALAAVPATLGHGQVNDPPPRNAYNIKGSVEGVAGTCAGGSCFWFNEGCEVGCGTCHRNGDSCSDPVGPQGATIPTWARTFFYNDEPSADQPGGHDFCGSSPWCQPGKAPVRSPCGVAGGSDQYNPHGNSGYLPLGAKQNQDGRTLSELSGVKTVWKAGSVVNASWAINANHGGGYQYRLCQKSDWPTEECFQAMPVKFANGRSLIKYCNQPQHLKQLCCSTSKRQQEPCEQEFSPCTGDEVAFDAVDVNVGTTPQGSTWRRNPIPACRGFFGGSDGQLCGKTHGESAEDYQFPPIGRDESRPTDRQPWGFRKQRNDYLGGFGAGGGCDNSDSEWAAYFSWNIVDELEVPDVPSGEYILSWRWDVEQGNQIWSSCSDVTIENPSAGFASV